MNRYATRENIENLKKVFGVGQYAQEYDVNQYAQKYSQNKSVEYKGKTKGQKLMEVFPEVEIRDELPDSAFLTFTLDHVVSLTVERAWWDAPYEEVKNES